MVSFGCSSLLLLLEHFPSQPGSNQRREKWVDHQEEIYHLCPREREICVLKGFCQDMYIKHSTPLYAFQTLAALHPIVYRTNSSWTLTECFGPWSLLHSLEENTENTQRCKNRMSYAIDNTTPFPNQFAQLYAMVATAKAQGIVSSTCTSWRSNCEKQLRPVLPTPHHGNSTAISGRVWSLDISILSFSILPMLHSWGAYSSVSAILHYHSP